MSLKTRVFRASDDHSSSITRTFLFLPSSRLCGHFNRSIHENLNESYNYTCSQNLILAGLNKFIKHI